MKIFPQLHLLLDKNLNLPGKHIYMLRHGQSKANYQRYIVGWTNPSLTIRGWKQVNKLYPIFWNHFKSFNSFHTSDLIRCKNTITTLLGFTGLKYKQSISLRQRNFGQFEGLNYKQMSKQSKIIINSLVQRPPNGQSLLQAKGRVLQYLNTLEDGHHLIVTHGGIINSFTLEFGLTRILSNCSILSMQFKDENAKKLNFIWEYPRKHQQYIKPVNQIDK